MSKVLVGIQARTNSSRLPAKALLPIGGLPLAVLCAKRAANTGLPNTILTSVDPTDDILVRTLEFHNVHSCRGSLEDVLSRFSSAFSAYDDDDLIFRLTADNPFPDGALLNQMISFYKEAEAEYLTCNGFQSGVPYGVSAELFRLSHLREANRNASSSYDREHVTPYIIRNYKNTTFNTSLGVNHNLRATIDIFEDYIAIAEAFSKVSEPINADIAELCTSLGKECNQPATPTPITKFTLGTAQLGGKYGIANKTGKPSRLEAERLVKKAITNHVCLIDTAHAYGDSETVLGKILKGGWASRVKCCTKLAPLTDIPTDISDSTLNAYIDASVYKSLSRLGLSTINVLMLHRAEQLTKWRGGALTRLRSLRDEGVIETIGVSVQNTEELVTALKTEDIQHIQIPFNILDWRWKNIIPQILQIKSKRPLELHARSAFLQGLLLQNKLANWTKAHISNPAPVIEWLRQTVIKTQSHNIADLCIRYAKSQDWVDTVVLGMERVEQLDENLQYLSQPDLEDSDKNWIESTRPAVNEVTLDPSKWKTA